MKINHLKQLLFVIITTLLLSSCSGLNKMKKNAELIRFNVEPEVLEVHGGEVPISLTAKFPEKYFNKKAILTATPVLKYNGEETKYKTITIQGEDVLANNKVIGYKSGGSIRYNDQISYIPNMRRSELYLYLSAEKGNNVIDFAPLKLADGIMATARMTTAPKTLVAIKKEENTSGAYNPKTDIFQRNVRDSKQADIHYIIGRSDIRKDEANADDIKELEEYTKNMSKEERAKLEKVKISSYASPDGDLGVNMELAAKRKESSLKFMLLKFKEAGIDVDLETRYTPEDWEGFRQLMEKSNIQDKELILRVLSMYKDPEVREREMRNLAETFTEVADEIMPKLRRSKFETDVELIGRTDDEIKSLAIAKPSELNQAELLHAASLIDNLDDKLTIYTSFNEQFPNDWRGYNNIGHILSEQNKFDEAKSYFEKAEQLENQNPIIKNNLGAIALYEDDIDNAEILLGSASGIDDVVRYNQGIIYLKKGEYDNAVLAFRGFNDINSAIAKLMAGDLNGAQRDLTSYNNPESYKKEYLLAVIGARKENPSMVFSKLQSAIKKNPAVKERARNDVEFASLLRNSNFQKLIE